MKTILIVTLIVYFNNGFTTGQTSLFTSHYPLRPMGPVPADSKAVLKNFTQKLDHSDDTDTTTWNQRYYVSEEFFNATANSVAFLLMGGESVIDVESMHYGNWITSARKYGAILFQLEHRFYGNSNPFNDLTLEHLQYLTSKQALADAANFIQSMNKEHALASDVKWIVFGGSYSGALAAWMRLKYPDLVFGAASSSAPLLAELDFEEYFRVIVDDLAATKEGCVDSLKAAMEQVESYMNDTEQYTVTQKLNLCTRIEGKGSDDLDVQTFYNVLARQIANVAQYNLQTVVSLTDVCNNLTNETRGPEIDRLVDVLVKLRGKKCLRVNYDSNMNYYNYTKSRNDVRPWMFQTCNEFGWFQRSDNVNGVFGKGAPLDFHVDICTKAFGPEYTLKNITDKVDATNEEYLGLRIYDAVTNVVFVHGSFDPFYKVGVPFLRPTRSVLIYVKGSSHCADMADLSDYDSPQLAQAKKEVDRLIGVWLGFNEERKEMSSM